MKVLLGGVPFGCDNIGDEAILACVVKMLRDDVPEARISVATADPGTAKRLGVEVVPPHGFAGVPIAGFGRVAAGADVYVWCGATGLSDYPDTALSLLREAQRAGVPTFVWGVGMDDELNPAFFKAAGRRKAILDALALTPRYEALLRRRLARRISKVLPRCRGVWLRDFESAAVLARFGFTGARVAADTAILQRGATGGSAKSFASGGSGRTLGLCISAQRRVADLDGARRLVDAVRASGARVAGIPMNPKTDRPLLESLGVECISGTSPEAVFDAAARCDVVLSSRLHLLILAANAGTPVMGLARGSKLANWLANFGRRVEGSVQDCDWDAATRRVLAALRDRGDWDAVRASAYARLEARLASARADFAAAIREACGGGRGAGAKRNGGCGV